MEIGEETNKVGSEKTTVAEVSMPPSRGTRSGKKGARTKGSAPESRKGKGKFPMKEELGSNFVCSLEAVLCLTWQWRVIFQPLQTQCSNSWMRQLAWTSNQKSMMHWVQEQRSSACGKKHPAWFVAWGDVATTAKPMDSMKRNVGRLAPSDEGGQWDRPFHTLCLHFLESVSWRDHPGWQSKSLPTGWICKLGFCSTMAAPVTSRSQSSCFLKTKQKTWCVLLVGKLGCQQMQPWPDGEACMTTWEQKPAADLGVVPQSAAAEGFKEISRKSLPLQIASYMSQCIFSSSGKSKNKNGKDRSCATSSDGPARPHHACTSQIRIVWADCSLA